MGSSESGCDAADCEQVFCEGEQFNKIQIYYRFKFSFSNNLDAVSPFNLVDFSCSFHSMTVHFNDALSLYYNIL